MTEQNKQSDTPAPSQHLWGKADAFDRIVAAQKTVIETVSNYNGRLEIVRAERDRGNWSMNVDAEYHAMSDAKSDFTRTVQVETSAAIAALAKGDQ